MRKVPVISESVLEALPQLLSSRGLEEAAIASLCDLRRFTDGNGELVIGAEAVLRLFEVLSAQLKDPVFGLHYAQAFPVGGTGAFGFILTHAKDMRTAVKAVARYTSLVMSAVDVRYERIDDGGQLIWRYSPILAGPNIQFNSFVAGLVILRLRAGLSPEWTPKSVHLSHRAPGDVATYKRVFGPAVAFDQPTNSMTFKNANLDRPNVSANPRLFHVVQQLGDILLASRAANADFRATVTNQIVDHLGVAAPTLEAVASELGMGQRMVQRRLAGEGTTFETILGETRKSVAAKLLRETDLNLTEIAFMLGFSELSAFTRAANRWFGVPPRQFRASERKRA